MKQSKLIPIYGFGLSLIFGLIVLHALLIVGFGTHFPHLALIIKAWKEILMILLIPLACILVYQTERQYRWMRDPLFWLIIAYFLIHIISLVQWHGVSAVLAGLTIDLRYVAYFSLVYVLIRVAPQYRPPMLKIAIGGAVIVIGFACMQLFLPHDILAGFGYSKQTIAPYDTIDQNHSFVREISTLRGPNPLGAYAMGVLILLVAWTKRWRRSTHSERWQVIIFAILSTVTLYVSFSRSAYLGLIIGLLAVGIAWWGKSRRFWYVLAGLVVVVGIIAAGVVSVKSNYVSNVLLHNNPTSGVAAKSDQGHLSSLANGLQMLVREPFGAGVGSTGSASLLGVDPLIIENQYLLIAHEVGWLGLGLFVAIFALMMQRLWRYRADTWTLGVFAAGIALAFIGFLLPVWADDTVSIVWWGLAAITIAGGDNGKRSAK